MEKSKCTVCGWVYDPAKANHANGSCPECGTDKKYFILSKEELIAKYLTAVGMIIEAFYGDTRPCGQCRDLFYLNLLEVGHIIGMDNLSDALLNISENGCLSLSDPIFFSSSTPTAMRNDFGTGSRSSFTLFVAWLPVFLLLGFRVAGSRFMIQCTSLLPVPEWGNIPGWAACQYYAAPWQTKAAHHFSLYFK